MSELGFADVTTISHTLTGLADRQNRFTDGIIDDTWLEPTFGKSWVTLSPKKRIHLTFITVHSAIIMMISLIMLTYRVVLTLKAPVPLLFVCLHFLLACTISAFKHIEDKM